MILYSISSVTNKQEICPFFFQELKNLTIVEVNIRHYRNISMEWTQIVTEDLNLLNLMLILPRKTRKNFGLTISMSI